MPVSPHHLPSLVPKTDIAQRISALQNFMQGRSIGCAWIQYPADRLYFTGTVQDGVLLIPAEGEAVFFARQSFSRAEAEAGVQVQPFPGRKGLVKAASTMLKERQRLALSFDVTPSSVYAMLQTLLPEAELADITLPVKTIKSVKSAWEVEQIRQATRQVELLFAELPAMIRPGMREIDLSAEAESFLRRRGHAGTIRVRMSPDPMGILTVASGDSALYPTAFDGPVGGPGLYPVTGLGAGIKELTAGETVTLDVVTAYNGYHADHTRVFFLGDPVPDAVRHAHQFCLDVLDRLQTEIRPGAIAMDIFNTVWSWAEAQGLPPGFMGAGENRVKFFAHGIGTELDEFPVLADRLDMPLQSGNVMAIEPKAFLPGVGGVGTESTFLVTENGCENLCATTAELICIK